MLGMLIDIKIHATIVIHIHSDAAELAKVTKTISDNAAALEKAVSENQPEGMNHVRTD